ncbi:MAG: hypothetical protein AABX71_02140, partial [Nanoarchaeota archaeon]
MAHKRFVKKRGKIYGPYYYESYRDGGKVKKKYLGKLPEETSEIIEKQETKSFSRGDRYRKYLLFIPIVIVVLALLFMLVSFFPSGRVVLQVSPVYRANESIDGSLTLNLKGGEMIPADSVVSARLGEQEIEIPLSELIDIEQAEGNYYAENTQLEGSGLGYGFLGEKKSYPQVSFRFYVYESKEPEENITEEIPTEENITEEIPTEQPAEPATEEPSEPAEEIPTEQPIEETTPEPSEEKVEEAGITGESVREEREKNGEEIEASVKKGEPYTLELKEKEKAEIVEGSVKSGEKPVSADVLDLDVSENILTISTEYEEIEEGFGADYLTDETKQINIDLKNLNLKAEQATLEISLSYGDIDIIKVSEEVRIEAEIPVNATNITEINVTIENVTIENITIENATGFTVKTTKGEVKLNSLVKWEKEILLDKPANITVELPSIAKNISVKKVKEGEEEDITTRVGLTGGVISGKVSAGIELEREPKFVRWIKSVFSSLKITGKVTENITTTENITEIPAEQPVEPEANLTTQEEQNLTKQNITETNITEVPEARVAGEE